MSGRLTTSALFAFGVFGVFGLQGLRSDAAPIAGGGNGSGGTVAPQVSARDRADAGQAHRTLLSDRQDMASYVRSNPGSSKAGWDVSLLRSKTQSLAAQARVIQRVAATAKSSRHGDLAAKILVQASDIQKQLDAVASAGSRPAPKNVSAIESSLAAIDSAARELAIIEPDILR